MKKYSGYVATLFIIILIIMFGYLLANSYVQGAFDASDYFVKENNR